MTLQRCDHIINPETDSEDIVLLMKMFTSIVGKHECKKESVCDREKDSLR